MSEIKLFSIGEQVEEIKPIGTTIDKSLQELVEANMKKFFGVSFVASNYYIGCGRVDSIGLDENKCPVVFEYTSNQDRNLISRGLFYLEQILDNKEKFTTSVSSKLGKKAAEAIDWTSPRIVVVAPGFNKYDRSAATQLSRNVSLIQYNRYGENLIMFELVESASGTPLGDSSKVRNSFAANYKKSNIELKELYTRVCDYVMYFGEGVTINQLRNYVAFKKIKNFGTIRVEPERGIVLNLNLEPSEYVGRGPNYKDVSFAAHYGTGLLQFTFNDLDGFEEAKGLLLDAYNRN